MFLLALLSLLVNSQQHYQKAQARTSLNVPDPNRPAQPANRPSLTHPFQAVDGTLPQVSCGYGCNEYSDDNYPHPHYHQYYAVDFALNGRSFPVLAAASGVLTRHDEPGLGGNVGTAIVAFIDHGNGWKTKYAHLSSITVRGQTINNGDSITVSQGESIGISGSTGATAVHLHFELRAPYRSGEYAYTGNNTWAYPVDDAINNSYSADNGFHMDINSPAEGDNLQDRAVVRGWAINNAMNNGTGVDHVHIYLDAPYPQGQLLGEATYGLPRPDVAQAFGSSQFTNSGYDFVWDVSTLSEGTHSLYIYARNIKEEWSAPMVRTVTVLPPPIKMDINSPAENVHISGQILVRGWAIHQASTSGTGISDVHVYLDAPYPQGQLLGAATYGVERADVAQAFGERYRMSGYEFLWDTSEISPGEHSLYIYAKSNAISDLWSPPQKRTIQVLATPAQRFLLYLPLTRS